MSIFGQVWLWSVAAFALGALLAWVLLARPAQARARELERKLIAAEVTPATPAPPRDPEPTRVQPVPAKDDDEAHTQQIQRVQPQAQPEPEPDPEPTEYVSPAPGWLERDSFDHRESVGEPGRDETIERELAEYDWDADPQPRYDESRYDESRYEPVGQQSFPAVEDRSSEREHLGASLFEPRSYREDEDSRSADAEHYQAEPHQTEPDERESADAEPYKPFEPVYVGLELSGQDDAGQDEDVLDTEPEESETEPETETAQGLPKRHRRESPRGGFEPPQPIQPSMHTVSRREPAPEQGGTHSGSLFEPAAPSADPVAPMAPPARNHEESAAPVPSGPFGPGSAMPLPGGGRPAPDFAVKASVTALRYCAEGSPQFPQMVAEVWFRTPTDAERVGFRPLA